jgi:hypothetical protein
LNWKIGFFVVAALFVLLYMQVRRDAALRRNPAGYGSSFLDTFHFPGT